MAKKKLTWEEQFEQALQNVQRQYPNITREQYMDYIGGNIGKPAKVQEKNLDSFLNERNEDLLYKNQEEANDLGKISEGYQELEKTVDPLIQADKQRQSADREQYKQEARQDVTTNLPGLTPQQRRQLQQGANAQINKQVQQYKRSMASQMGRRGIRGGAAFAPQAEIARSGLEAQRQFQTDLADTDIDLAMRRLAAYLSGVEGRSAQDLLRRGQYLDYIIGRQQQGKEAAYNQYFKNLFSRMK